MRKMKTAKQQEFPVCYHPELVPAMWGQEKPEPARMIGTCPIHDYICPVCGFGVGCSPGCDCSEMRQYCEEKDRGKMTGKEKQKLNEKLIKFVWPKAQIHYSEWDTDKSSPEFIPSGKPWRTHKIDARPIPKFTDSPDACFKYLVPKSEMDILWIINNLDSPIPSIKYCFGFSREESNDVLCWSKALPIETCLSPLADSAAIAISLAVEKLIDSKEAGNDIE